MLHTLNGKKKKKNSEKKIFHDKYLEYINFIFKDITFWIVGLSGCKFFNSNTFSNSFLNLNRANKLI